MLSSKFANQIKQNEKKSNIYTAKALLICELILAVILLLNELKIFHCDAVQLRTAVAISGILLLIPSIIVKKTDARQEYVKYVIILCSIAVTLAITMLLSFHVTLLYLFPILIAVQYNERNACITAIIGCLVCTFISPIFSHIFGLWDNEFLKFLVQTAANIDFDNSQLIYLNANTSDSINQIILYLTLPKAMIIAALSPLIFAVNDLNRERLHKQFEVLTLSQTDILTGLFNRNCFEHDIKELSGKKNISAVYIDINGLHEMNNTKGHGAGDQMLKTIADEIESIFGTGNSYRIGGDEFVALCSEVSEEELADKAEQLRVAAISHHYNVSVGFAVSGDDNDDIELLVRSAEQEMYKNKQHFYESRLTENNNRYRLHHRPSERNL